MLEGNKVDRKDLILAASLSFIVFITLFLAAYFNATSGEAINPTAKDLEDKYYLSGPDPYYNLRVVKKEFQTGHYPYWNLHNPDPLLNYPIGKINSRPPIFNTLFVIFAKILSNFMSSVDAIGLSMQFLTPLYGALLVIPVYFIGSLLFNRKIGLISALMVPLIPIHLGSGHGSAYSLADHDAFILLIATTMYYFLMKSLSERDMKKSMLYAAISGTFLSMESLTWAGGYFFFDFLSFYFVIQMFIDIVRYDIDIRRFLTAIIVLGLGILVSLPLYIAKGSLEYMVIIPPIVVFLFGLIYLFLSKKKLPWLITIPSIISLATVVLAFLYVIKDSTNPDIYPIARFAHHIFGGLAYVEKSKVYLTIAEASTFGISRTIMSFGPALYLIAWAGFLYLIFWKRLIKKWDGISVFITVWFLVEVYLTSSAGRFINDLVPLVAFLSAGALGLVTDKLNFRQMAKLLRNIRDFRGLKKAVKISHVLWVLFLAFIVVIPNAFLSMDAAVPSIEKREIFGKNYQGAFGLGLHTEKYWEDAFGWLRHQDKNIKDDAKRPAFISWWDYGFYCVAMGEHPTVADNFQDGIEAAGNFHTSESEKEAISVLIVRLCEGDMEKHGGRLSQGIKDLFNSYLGNNSTKLIDMLEDPVHHRNTSNSTFGKIIGKEYGGERYRVRKKNAMYHDSVKLLTNLLDEEKIVMLYRDLQLKTGWSIRYYGVEGYDVNIFNVFTFLSDKGVFGYETNEDKYFKLYYRDRYGKLYTPEEVESMSKNLSREDMYNLDLKPWVKRKDPFFRSMVYRVYFGSTPKDLYEAAANGTVSFGLIPFFSDNSTNPLGPGNYYYQPTAGLKHFVIKYLSPLNLTRSLYFHRGYLCFGMPAVVIAKYYEGAKINGSIRCMGKPMGFIVVTVRDDFRQTLQTKLINGKIINRTIEKIPHDIALTDSNGNFSVIAPAGNITLSLQVAADQYHRYTIKDVTFNSTADPQFYPVTEKEATRAPGVNYNRSVNITVEPSNLTGIVFDDKNGNGTYDQGVDVPLSNVQITLRNRITGDVYNLMTNLSGYYNVSRIFPGIYDITADYQGFEIHNNSILFLSPGNNYYNITKPKLSSIKGTVFYDKNSNGSYDTGEEMGGVRVNLIYKKTNSVVKSTITNGNGSYEFKDIFPGKYIINATQINLTTGNLAYNATVSIYLEENKTLLTNISLNLAKIKFSGSAEYNSNPMNNVTIDLEPAGDVKNNTAQSESIRTNATGQFEIYLTPGTYNISAYKYEFVNSTNKTIYYHYEGRITVLVAQSPITNYNIALTRKELEK